VLSSGDAPVGFRGTGKDNEVQSNAGVPIVISDIVCVLLQEEEVAGDVRASAGFGLASKSSICCGLGKTKRSGRSAWAR
jgi:hypothetical protein